MHFSADPEKEQARIEEARRKLADVFAGKNPFEKSQELDSNTKVGWEETEKKRLDVSTHWSELIAIAERCPEKPNIDSISEDSLGAILLDTALAKTVRLLSGSVGLDSDTVRRVVISYCKNSRYGSKTVANAVRYLRDFDESAFTECAECGKEIDPQSEDCKYCHVKREF